MKIFVLSPIYATTTQGAGATPVVHYFTREWVKIGHEVVVFNLVAKFPKIIYWIGRHFQHRLNTKLGMLVPIETPTEEDYLADGVIVHRRCMKKLVPHARYSKRQIQRALSFISDVCDKNGKPDWFVGHWDNPQLELLDALKQRFGVPTCIVFHSNEFDFEQKYGEDGLRMLANIDVIGFRSNIGQNNYIAKYGAPKHSFVACSGVSEAFLKAGSTMDITIQQPIHNFVYVGSLIGRKFPSTIVTALSRAYPKGDFTITFIGDGAEKGNVEEEQRKQGGLGKVNFTGRIPREEIIEYLKKADVFVMISKDEIFGLVYLEAMALGLIPIGSKNEGIDGVIKDGENGFLCEAGNVDELTEVLEKIKQMPMEQLRQIAQKAKATALDYSDEGVAKQYIDALVSCNG